MKGQGFGMALEALRALGQEEQKRLIEQMKELDPERAEQMQAALFTFEDLVQLNPKSVPLVIGEFSLEKWGLALRNASKELFDFLIQHLTRRKADQLRESVESTGPKPLRQVQEAQKAITEHVLALEADGRVYRSKQEDDPLV